jgi:hypothetical protein
MIARRLRRGIGFADMALGLLFVVFAARALLMPASADTYWHLRTGADILRTGAVPRVESYSFTALGSPWRNHEWLWEPLSYACYRLGGMPLLTVFGAAFVIAALALIFRLMKGPAPTRFLLLLVGLPLSIPLWGLRPHLFTLAALPLLLALLARGRLWPIPPLFVLWANMHGGVALGGLLLGVATALALVRWRIRGAPEDRRRALALGVVLPLSAAACLATPLGAGIFHFLSDSMARIRAVGIGEWQPTVPVEPYGVIFWVVALAFVALAVVRRRALGDGGHASGWGDWVIVAAPLALLPLAIVAVRNAGLFALLALPAASRLLGPEATLRLPWRRGAAPPSGTADRPRANLALLAGLSLAALAFVAWSYRTAAPTLGWRPIDERALAAVRACDGPLYNQYDEGGYLIWFLPERPVFVDNRQDPYPVEHIRAQLDVQWEAAPYRPLFERWGIRCAFLPVVSSTVGALDRDGWRTRYRDDRYVVLAAPAGTGATSRP